MQKSRPFQINNLQTLLISYFNPAILHLQLPSFSTSGAFVRVLFSWVTFYFLCFLFESYLLLCRKVCFLILIYNTFAAKMLPASLPMLARYVDLSYLVKLFIYIFDIDWIYWEFTSDNWRFFDNLIVEINHISLLNEKVTMR